MEIEKIDEKELAKQEIEEAKNKQHMRVEIIVPIVKNMEEEVKSISTVECKDCNTATIFAMVKALGSTINSIKKKNPHIALLELMYSTRESGNIEIKGDVDDE